MNPIDLGGTLMKSGESKGALRREERRGRLTLSGGPARAGTDSLVAVFHYGGQQGPPHAHSPPSS